MVMRRHPSWADYHLNRRPKTYHEAQVSLPYSVAVALIEGAALFPQYQNEKLGDVEIRRLSDILEIVPDDTLPRGVSCHLTATTTGGASLVSQVDHPKGSIANPMTEAEMQAKVRLLSTPVLGEAKVAQLIEALGDLSKFKTMNEVMRLTVAETVD
jgi:2-methylcitrate dehydratase PrpD